MGTAGRAGALSPCLPGHGSVPEPLHLPCLAITWPHGPLEGPAFWGPGHACVICDGHRWRLQGWTVHVTHGSRLLARPLGPASPLPYPGAIGQVVTASSKKKGAADGAGLGDGVQVPGLAHPEYPLSYRPWSRAGLYEIKKCLRLNSLFIAGDSLVSSPPLLASPLGHTPSLRVGGPKCVRCTRAAPDVPAPLAHMTLVPPCLCLGAWGLDVAHSTLWRRGCQRENVYCVCPAPEAIGQYRLIGSLVSIPVFTAEESWGVGCSAMVKSSVEERVIFRHSGFKATCSF